jgi:MFS family permease
MTNPPGISGYDDRRAPGLATAHRALGPKAILASVREAQSGRVLAYLLGMQAAVNVAAPFFTPYMLGPLALSYVEFMSLTAAAFLARVLVLPFLGRIAQRRGTRAILWWGAMGIVPLPVLWLVSHDFAYLLALQIFAGSAWDALELATLLSFFEGIKVLRGTQPATRLFAMRLRTLAVRPSAGAIERPILASVGSEAPAAPVPRSREDASTLPPSNGAPARE